MVCFQPPSLLIRKAWVPVMHFCVSHTLQSALMSGQEARIMQIDFSAAFDRVHHYCILKKLCSLGIGGSGVVGINWLPLYQECRRPVFSARYCSSCTLRSFFPFILK